MLLLLELPLLYIHYRKDYYIYYRQPLVKSVLVSDWMLDAANPQRRAKQKSAKALKCFKIILEKTF